LNSLKQKVEKYEFLHRVFIAGGMLTDDILGVANKIQSRYTHKKNSGKINLGVNIHP